MMACCLQLLSFWVAYPLRPYALPTLGNNAMPRIITMHVRSRPGGLAMERHMNLALDKRQVHQILCMALVASPLKDCAEVHHAEI